jgi:hypothetical protein
MLKRLPLLAIAAAMLLAPIGHLQPARADIIDRLIIKNDTTDATVYYDISKASGAQTGCLRHRQEFNEGFLFKPSRVDFKIYKSYSECPHNGKVLLSKAMNYWAPKTTYTVTGSPHHPDTLSITQQH